MSEQNPQAVYRRDYQIPSFLLETVSLQFELHPEATHVEATLTLKRNPTARAPNVPLVLQGEDLVLNRVILNDTPLTPSDYEVTDESLTILNPPDQCQLTLETTISPARNKQLSGLYCSGDYFCTQCEAEGFRRITYFLDRPDVLARYTTTLIADKTAYPLLLSNGNRKASGELENNRHWVTWEDPFPKPSYLFALVAGDFAVHKDHFTTSSGRQVQLELIVEKPYRNKCEHAMACLKRAMRWDEQRFAREYDLDIYMIVAVADFNMGAMENKGLNIFNAKFVLADPETATDEDFVNIEAVIAHEYFHNWTGNRITCRDWFQLSLKEGLTIFREQSYLADLFGKDWQRIREVKDLRRFQFPQDASPLAHPVRPDHYLQIDNFYTATVYEKGAEIIRMIQSKLGPDAFDRGMAYYFNRFDGMAVTIEDFLQSFEIANNEDLSSYRYWYSQAGTPEVYALSEYDESKQTLRLTLEQITPPTESQPIKRSLPIPIQMAFYNRQGEQLSSVYLEESKQATTEQTIELTQATQAFHFSGLPEEPSLSLLRHFSAPIKLFYPHTYRDLHNLVLHEHDGFSRWEAMQQLWVLAYEDMLEAYHSQQAVKFPPALAETYSALLTKLPDDHALAAELLQWPSVTALAEMQWHIDIDAIQKIHRVITQKGAELFKDDWVRLFDHEAHAGDYQFNYQALGHRALKNTALRHLAWLFESESIERCSEQYTNAKNMTDKLAALEGLATHENDVLQQSLQHFHQRWHSYPLQLDRWFSIQASIPESSTVERVAKLLNHEQYIATNPNRVRALLGVFSRQNICQFHRNDGAGYQLLADQIQRIDQDNPQLAARLAEPFTHWQRHTQRRQALMQQQIKRLLEITTLSKDSYEILSKTLPS